MWGEREGGGNKTRCSWCDACFSRSGRRSLPLRRGDASRGGESWLAVRNVTANVTTNPGSKMRKPMVDLASCPLPRPPILSASPPSSFLGSLCLGIVARAF